MSQASLAAATALDARVTAIDTQIAGIDTRIAAVQASLTVAQRRAAEATALEDALRMGSIYPIVVISRNFEDSSTVLAQRMTVWIGLRIRRALAVRERAALVDFAAQCRNAEQVHEFLRLPLTATQTEVEDAVYDAVTAYVRSCADDEVATAILSRRVRQ